MTNFLNFHSGLARTILTSAALLTLSVPVDAQTTASSQAVYGRCEVRAEIARDNFGQCHLTGTVDGAVPADKQLVVEHMAVTCMGPLDRQIMTLALGTSLKPDSGAFTQIAIPLARREVQTTEKLSRYEASLQTRLYAGPGTKLEPYLSMEFGYVPSPKASCGVMFHGRLEPVQ